MALRAGVAVADLEFMQFHPTALHHPSMPRPLLSEALRGEGAILRDDQGAAFMADEHPLADLAPRDVVARAISRRLNERGARPPVARRHRASTASRRGSPRSGERAGAVGLDPTRDWLPVAPGRALPLGWRVHRPRRRRRRSPACGRAARPRAPGVHGANRLASNSLLEGLVFAARAGRSDRRAARTATSRPVCCASVDRREPSARRRSTRR